MVPIPDIPKDRAAVAPRAPLQIDIDPRSSLPLFRQIYNGIRSAILEGRLRPGERLPATRMIAGELGVSRNTALAAFDQLLSEGYLEGRTGSGTYVTEHLPEHLLQAAPASGRTAGSTATRRELSRYGKMIAGAHGGISGMPDLRPFQSRGPALDAFPFDIWERIATRHIRGLSRRFFSYGDPAGYTPLRIAVADYLRSARAVRCTPEQVIIVAGAQQGIDLAARVLLDPGDRVLVEDPGYLGTRGALKAVGAEVIPVPTDAEGFRIDVGRERGPDARMVCVTPSHNYPLGVVMSLARRLELLEWAGQAGAWIVEDDYDSEYRYGGRPISSLQGLDASDRVIYVGTFSKVLFPGLRLGYLVVPDDLVAAMSAARASADRHGPTLESAITATFIEEGHFARHIRRMRVLYRERQTMLVELARKELKGLLEVSPSDAGMHLIGWLPEGADDREATRRAAEEGVLVHSLSAYTIREKLRPGLILGYTHFDERTMRRGIRGLARALESMQAG
jgi:GntR family transcriptional regulator/MocR family aminotransferase